MNAVRTPDRTDADAALSRRSAREAGPIVASLHRLTGDFDVAEEAVQDARGRGARGSWRVDGIPDKPGAWLQVAARRNALDRLRRRQRQEKALDRLRSDVVPRADDDGPDERLPLLFGCCHPALAVEARVALTLRAVVGLTTLQIARAFLVSEQTMAQRIVRGQAQDRGRRDPVDDAPCRPVGGPAGRRTDGDVPDVQRGLRVHVRPGRRRPRPRRRRAVAGRAGGRPRCPTSRRRSACSRC